MTTPRGCLKSIATALKRLARNGDVEAFRAYLCSDAFLAAFSGLDPQRRRSAMRSYAKAEALCEANGTPSVGQGKTHRCQARPEGQLG